MFGSAALDVAIGLSLIYLLFSTICSAVSEILEGFTKNRAKDLERGIRELLCSGDSAATVDHFYNHPLINSLYQGSFVSAAKKKWWHVGVSLPSYIPSRSFALAVMDLVLPGTAAGSSGASGALQSPSAPSTPTVVVNAAAPTPVVSALGSAAAAAAPAPAVAPSPIAQLRAAILSSTFLNDQTRRALVALIDAAGDDVAQARQNIEEWYNTAMDRVSGWYKRRTQMILFGLALIIAGSINVDTIGLVNSLSTDKMLRDSLAAAAQEYTKQAAATPPQVAPTAPANPANSGAGNSASPCADPECRAEQATQQMKALGLPIGWSGDSIAKNPRGYPDDLGGWLLKIVGWLLTAFAVSLGSPFWFDLLNKFVAVRSTVKPPANSPQPGSN